MKDLLAGASSETPAQPDVRNSEGDRQVGTTRYGRARNNSTTYHTLNCCLSMGVKSSVELPVLVDPRPVYLVVAASRRQSARHGPSPEL